MWLGSIFLLSRRVSFHVTLSFHMTKLHWNDSSVSCEMTLFVTVEKWTLSPTPNYDGKYTLKRVSICFRNIYDLAFKIIVCLLTLNNSELKNNQIIYRYREVFSKTVKESLGPIHDWKNRIEGCSKALKEQFSPLSKCYLTVNWSVS